MFIIDCMKSIFLFILLCFQFHVSGQIDATALFIKGFQDDAEKIVSTYLDPFQKCIALSGQNNNLLVFKSDRTTKWRFGFGLDLSTSIVNRTDYTYDINKLDLQEFELVDPERNIAQTIAGSNESVQLKMKKGHLIPLSEAPFISLVPILTLDSPKGAQVNFMTFPLLHFMTEKNGNTIEFKYFPKIRDQKYDTEVYNIGFGMQHNLETSLRFMKNFWFDIYVSGGYNFNRLAYFLEVKPTEYFLSFSLESDKGPYENQEFQLSTENLPIRLNLVRQVKKVSFTIGSSYCFSKSIIRMIGNYPIYYANEANQFQILVKDIKDPLNIVKRYDQLAVEAGFSYRSKHFVFGLNGVFSYYKNINMSFGFLF